MKKESLTGDKLHRVAAAVLMTVMFAARWARFDLLRAVGHLATKLHAWDEWCDKRLERLMAYIDASLKGRFIGFIGDKLEDLTLTAFADADFAGDRKDCKSTSGGFLCLTGPRSFFPLVAYSKKQGGTSTSTPEAELVALADFVKNSALPALSLWRAILGKDMPLVIYEDNEAAATICRTGKFKAMRHVLRHHGVRLGFLHDCVVQGVTLIYEIVTRLSCVLISLLSSLSTQYPGNQLLV